MPNQYDNVITKIDIVYRDCGNPECNKKVRCVPNRVRRGQNKYCSSSCAHKVIHASKYTLRQIRWIARNIKTMKIAKIAEKFGITEGAMKKAICDLRQRGHKITKGKKGRPSVEKKVKASPRPIVEKPIVIVTPEKKRKTRTIDLKVNYSHPPKKEPEKLPTREISMVGKRFVKVGNGTWALRAANA